MSGTHGTNGALEYESLAARHRPSDPAVMAREIRRLADSGLSARDISVALRLSYDYIVNVLGSAGS